jgi:hypothetical protein
MWFRGLGTVCTLTVVLEPLHRTVGRPWSDAEPGVLEVPLVPVPLPEVEPLSVPVLPVEVEPVVSAALSAVGFTEGEEERAVADEDTEAAPSSFVPDPPSHAVSARAARAAPVAASREVRRVRMAESSFE